MGEGKATRAEAVTADFGKGVPVEVMEVGLPWAQQVMQNYEPADEPASERKSAGRGRGDPLSQVPFGGRDFRAPGSGSR